jgi:lipoprotein Spr/probable lipoprotein NlpC
MFQDHVGIFFEKNRFIHASSAKGVMISGLNEPYWQDSLVKAARLYDYTHTAAR